MGKREITKVRRQSGARAPGDVALNDGQVVATVDAPIVDIVEIAHQTAELEPKHWADYWEIANGIGQRV